MTFSVWDPARRDYVYYEGTDSVGVPEAKHLALGGVGMSPYRAAWPLPADARPSGRGREPRGVIADRMSGALGDVAPGVKSILIVGVATYLVWRWLR